MGENINAGFSQELEAFIEEWKNKPGNLIMILHKVQEEQGYISKDAASAFSNPVSFFQGPSARKQWSLHHAAVLSP